MDSQRGREQGPEQSSVHPADGHPLGLCPKLLHGSLELTKGPLQIAVDQAEVEVVPISPLDAAALLHCPPQIRLLSRTRGFVSASSLPPASEGSTTCLPHPKV